MSNIASSIALNALKGTCLKARTTVPIGLITGPFGGWVSAIMLKAATSHMATISPEPKAANPVSMTVNFIAPITAPTVQLQVIVQKTTRTLCFMRVEATQILEDKSMPVASAMVILGPRRGDLHLVRVRGHHPTCHRSTRFRSMAAARAVPISLPAMKCVM